MKHYRLGIRGKIMSGYIALIICLIVANVILNEQITKLQVERNALISYDVTVRSKAQQLEQQILRIDASMQRYRNTNDEVYLQQYDGHKKLWKQVYSELENIVHTQMDDEELHIIERHITLWFELLPTKQQRQSEDTVQQSEVLFQAFEHLFANFYAKQDDTVQRKMASLDRTTRFLAINLFIALSLTAIVTMVIFQLIARRIVTSIRQVSTAISYMANADVRGQRLLEATTHDEVQDLVQVTNILIETMEREQWLQRNVTKTMASYQRATTLEELANIVLQQVTMRTKSASSAWYMHASSPLRIAAILFNGHQEQALYDKLVAQCYETKQSVIYNHPDVTTNEKAHIALKETYVVPIFFQQRVVATMLFSSFEHYSDVQYDFMKQVARELGMMIDHVKSRMHIEQLLTDSQLLTKELKAQSTSLYKQAEELKHLNRELEARTNEAEHKTKVLQATKKSLQNKAQQLQQASAYKSVFLANMSHELRTPLNSILALSEMLQHDMSREEVAEYATVIHQSGSHLLAIINDVLDLSKIEAGKMELMILPVSIRDICIKTAALFQPIAQQKDITFTCDDKDAPDIIYTDEKRLLQIIHNIVGNALKFTKEGSVSVTFCEKVWQGEEALQIVVNDTGIGIPEDKQRLIFESFQQLQYETIRPYGGTGLGLAISREFTQLLRGGIFVESEEGVGSTFMLTIPLQFKGNFECKQK